MAPVEPCTPLHITVTRDIARGETVMLSTVGKAGPSGGASLLGGPPHAFRAGTLLCSGQGEPLLQLLGHGWLPIGEVHSTACSWIQALSAIQPGALELLPSRRGWSLAWITLSDKGARGEREDRSGPQIEGLVRARLPISLSRGFLLPDSLERLRCLLTDLALLQGFDLILTSGGTGVGPRDVSPEATALVLDKVLPGFERVMTATSLAKTPHAMISRAKAGILGQSIVINLPGSPAAVQENLAAVLPALDHALAKLQGDPSDCGRG
jgi:molybdopterin adenylyltransferase